LRCGLPCSVEVKGRLGEKGIGADGRKQGHGLRVAGIVRPGNLFQNGTEVVVEVGGIEEGGGNYRVWDAVGMEGRKCRAASVPG